MDKNSIDWLKKLISFDTTSRNSNLELIASIHDWFANFNVKAKIIADKKEKKANIFATLPAHNGTTTGGIVLSGHTDVVPVDGQKWDTDPFCATQIGDKIYGRGTSDMKSFIAVTLALLPEMLKQKLIKPIHFAFSYDEEVGCQGAVSLIEDILKSGIKPEACIVGEPTEMRPVVAHKGINCYRCRVQGNAAHSSLTPKGCNAIEYAAQLICKIRELGDQFKLQGPFDQFYDVPFTSVSTNMIQGGNALNTIPAYCELFFEFRNLPTIKPASIFNEIQHYIKNDLLPRMQKEYASANIEMDALAAVPGLQTSEDDMITQLLRKITKEDKTLKVAYATEAGMFQQADIPTVVCGPGSIEQAHRANEFINIEQITSCEAFLRNVLNEISVH